jgi:hypothetical protein
LRELEAAAALAHAGYSVSQNPTVTPQEIQRGIRPGVHPDYRIEGVLFDCYSPEPPLVMEEQSRLDIFHEYDVAVGENDYDGRPWENDPAYPHSNPTYKLQDVIDERVRAGILDKVRDALNEKAADRQAFGFVVNLSEVTEWVGIEALGKSLGARSLSNFIHYVFAVAPFENAPTHSLKTESVEPGQFLRLGGNARLLYRPQFNFGSFAAKALEVELVFVRSN